MFLVDPWDCTDPAAHAGNLISVFHNAAFALLVAVSYLLTSAFRHGECKWRAGHSGDFMLSSAGRKDGWEKRCTSGIIIIKKSALCYEWKCFLPAQQCHQACLPALLLPASGTVSMGHIPAQGALTSVQRHSELQQAHQRRLNTGSEPEKWAKYPQM